MSPKPLICVLNGTVVPAWRDLRGPDAAGIDARRGGVLHAPVGAVGIDHVVERQQRSFEVESQQRHGNGKAADPCGRPTASWI